MKKVLISWVAVMNDFSGSEVNVNGPSANMHKTHWVYDYHLLLYTDDFHTKANALKKYLTDRFKHVVKLKKVDIELVHEDLTLIKAETEKILEGLKNSEIDILLSTGSGIMKIAWYICHTSLNLKTRLLQILPPKDSKNFPDSDLVEIKTELSQTPLTAIIQQKIINKKAEFPLITETLIPTYQKALKIAAADNVSVIISGNTGTGKEVLAKYIHDNSVRKKKKFIAMNCSAFTETVLESRLFGHKKGSFTDASTDQQGIFELADGGTVFLDEIGDISPYVQQSLLRFLQEKEIQPLGGNTKKVDVRVIAATNKNLFELMEKNLFRADLFYRLGVNLNLPDFEVYKTAEKKKWIEEIIKVRQRDFEREKISLSDDLINFLLNYSFSGNIRELINIIDYLYVFCSQKATIKDLPEYLFSQQKNSLKLDDVVRVHIKKVLEQCNGNKSQAAKIMGISINTLKSKLD